MIPHQIVTMAWYSSNHGLILFFIFFLESTTRTNTHEHVGGVHRFRQGQTCFLRVRLA